MKRLVVLGGGTAGTIVANKLRAAVPAHELSITVVDRNDEHHYQPGYLFLPFGSYTAKDLVKPRHSLFAHGINLVTCEISRVDAEHSWVELADGREIGYDFLVIATGVTPRPDQTPGMDGSEFGLSVHEFYTMGGAQKLAEALRHFRGGRLVVHITDMPIKCPVAPLEFTFLVETWLRDHGIRKRTKLSFVTPLDGAFTKPVASRELGHMLTDRHIRLVSDFAVESIDNETKELVSYDGRRVPFDLLVTIPLNMGADYVARSGLGDDLNLVPCDQHTMKSIEFDNIYVLGDAGTLQTSKAGSVAHFSIEIFVENFVELLKGEKSPEREFDGHANCFVETGHGKAMLLDFNYTTQPYTGVFPFPGVGPMKLLGESRINHMGKLGFRWVYWNLLLPGRKIPLSPDMQLGGKHVEKDDETTPKAPEDTAESPSTIPNF